MKIPLEINMLDRTVQPVFKKSSALSLLHPETLILANGIPVTLVPGGEQDVVKIEFIFEAGKWHESHTGVSYFMSNLLQKGTATKNSYQISSETEQLGVNVEVSPGYDFTSLSLYGLTKNIGQVLALTQEIITAPVFPQHELDQVKTIYLQSLNINLGKTSFLASRGLRKNLFGTTHPYGRDAERQDVEAIQQSWLVDFHKQWFGNFRILCAGKITDALVKDLTATFGSILITPAAQTIRFQPNPLAQHEIIPKADSVQASLRLGNKTISRTHADYPALLLLNHIFGGYFGSRLMKNIREEKGLTYGIYSSITALKHESFISIGTDVNKENSAWALQEIKNEMNVLCSDLIGASELEIARNHFIGSLQGEITTSFAHADKIKNLILFGLPDDYYQQLITKIDTLTPQDLREVANRYLNPATFSTVTVG